MHRVQVGIVFDNVFFLQLTRIKSEDIRAADPYLYSSCKQILDMDAGSIVGHRKVVELYPGVKSLVV